MGNLAGGCDKTNIGAVEVELFSNDALDAILRQIAFVGNPDPSDSQTPTPSRTRSPAPTASNTPSRTPTPTPSSSIECSLICNCPVFTCHIVYSDIAFCQPDQVDQKIGSRQQLKFHDFSVVSHFFNLVLAVFDTFRARQSSLAG